MLIFRSASKNTFFENRLNDGGVNFMNALNNITKKICRCSKADSFTFLITPETGMHITQSTIIYLKVLYKIQLQDRSYFFSRFSKQKSLKFDLLDVKSASGFSNSDVTPFQIFSQTPYKYIMAQYQKKPREMKLGFGLFTKTVGKGILTLIKYG